MSNDNASVVPQNTKGVLTMPRQLRESWTPNGHVTARINLGLVCATLAILIFAWCFKPDFIPGPTDILNAFPKLIAQGMVENLIASFTCNFEAIVLSCVITIPLAYLTVVPMARPFVRWVCKTRFLGMTGFVIFFTIVFGGGHGLKLALLVFGMGSFLIQSLYDIVESIPREEFDHARTLRLGEWGAVLEVVVLGKLDAVLDAIRQNAAMGWVMLTMVEGLVRSEGGLGTMLLNDNKHFQLESVFALQLVILLIGVLQDWGMVRLRRALCPYADLTLERR